MNVVEQNEQLLSLKVMRLTRPTIVHPHTISSKSNIITDKIAHIVKKEDVAAVMGAENLGAGQLILLPQSFGNIYLGETFSSYICVHNCATHPIDGVNVMADLQSNSTRIRLSLNKRTTAKTLDAGQILDDVIHYEVKEIGTHILVCEVHYLTSAGFERSFRKFFKFQVLKPLDVKTKFYNAETDEIYLETQIQNITSGTISLEKVELGSSEQYSFIALNTLSNGESVFATKNLLKPQNSCQFLFCIKSVANFDFLNANNIGKLDMIWRSNLGERGRLQTTQLQRIPIEQNDLSLVVVEAKNIVNVDEQFKLTCRITNTTNSEMNLNAKLKTNSNFGCDYTGSTEFVLGNIEGGGIKEFSLNLLFAKSGLVKITGLLITNTLTQKSYEFSDFVQVFVVDSDYREDEIFQMMKFVRFDLAQLS